jgi:hypothetical protein
MGNDNKVYSNNRRVSMLACHISTLLKCDDTCRRPRKNLTISLIINSLSFLSGAHLKLILGELKSVVMLLLLVQTEKISSCDIAISMAGMTT